MSRPGKIIVGILGVIFILFFVLIFLSFRLVNKSLPETKGKVEIKGLQAQVKIYRDALGIPHIIAENEHDLFLATGFVASQDRFWQMDLIRRAAKGRLSEIFGPITVKDDEFLLTMGFNRMAKKIEKILSPESRALYQAYSEGINAYLDAYQDRLPIEFALLGYRPEKWKIEDSIGFVRLMAWELNYTWRTELTYSKLIERFGESRAREIFPDWDPNWPTIIPPNLKPFTRRMNEFEERETSVRNLLGFQGSHIGSNSWVVSGKRSTTGKPLLANDPHLGFAQPAKWYEMHLVAPGWNVYGVTLAGVPGMVIGHNRAVAWGLTNVMADDADFYIETVQESDSLTHESTKYLFDGTWHDIETIIDSVRIKGNTPRVHITRLTHHGPIISGEIHDPAGNQVSVSAARKNPNQAITMCWTAYEPSDELGALYWVNRGKNWSEVSQKLAGFRTPGQNFIYADTSGTIAYYTMAAIPIRKKGNGPLPLDGTKKENDWKGFVPFHEQPHMVNPPEGFIATANNKTVDEKYPYYIGHLWESPSRIERIRELLKEKDKYSLSDFKRMQMDVVSPHAREMMVYGKEAIDQLPAQTDPRFLKIQKYFQNWDYAISTESVAATIFQVFEQKLFERIYQTKMGEELYQEYIGLSNVPLRMTPLLLKNEQSWWFTAGNEKTEGVESRKKLLYEVLLETIKDLGAKLGDNVDAWRWEKLHTLTFEHPLGKQKPLDFVFNLGPYPTGGSSTTINNGEYMLRKPYKQILGPSTRQIVDLGDIEKSLAINTTGQSGQPNDVHYRDQVEMWLNGLYHEVFMDPARLESAGYNLLELVPAK